MAEVQFIVYRPPRDGLPFLAVEMLADGGINATPYESEAEAERHRTMAMKTIAEGKEGESGLDRLLP